MVRDEGMVLSIDMRELATGKPPAPEYRVPESSLVSLSIKPEIRAYATVLKPLNRMISALDSLLM